VSWFAQNFTIARYRPGMGGSRVIEMLPAWMIDQIKREEDAPRALHIGDEYMPIRPRDKDRENEDEDS
jgi:hypothetical protein